MCTFEMKIRKKGYSARIVEERCDVYSNVLSTARTLFVIFGKYSGKIKKLRKYCRWMQMFVEYAMPKSFR